MKIPPHHQLVTILLLIQILVVARNLQSDLFSFFWFCDFIPVILAFCFLLHKVQAVKGILNIGLFAQTGYIIVILAKIIFGTTLFNFVFDFPLTPQYVIPTIIIHTSTLIAFWATYKIKPTNEALLYSFMLLFSVFIVVILFGDGDASITYNYNFIYNSNLLAWLPSYTQLWIPLVFIFVAIPTQLFQHIIHLFYSRRKVIQ